ncbi:DUF3558 domain-containing protein [Pseudonocardia hispaniensis]|uniref:DUF3558 domain-containing protein n=1 Tax=Pseudonocardia hispaniensis TaxID=904933 RepID=A0ABW1J5V9_9PSEU
MTTRLVAHLLVLLALTTGCTALPGNPAPTTPDDPETSRLPTRPRDIPVDEIEPCDLLTADQLMQLEVSHGAPTNSHVNPSRSVCQWGRFPDEPQDFYLMTVDTGRGAAYALGSVTGGRIVDVAGYAAVETRVGSSPEDRHCVLLVDVAAGQNLWVQYDYTGKTVPITKQLACQKAHTAAEMAVQTLRERTGR